MKKINVVYMGTPDFAVLPLKLLNEIANVVLVVTKKDAYVGRKKILTPSPVKQEAANYNIETFTPNNIREDHKRILEVKPDIIITCAYGQIIPKILLETPLHKCINVHASLLPKYRGGSPISKSIMNGDKVTGITIMYMSEGMDDGDIISQEKVLIEENDNIITLSEKLSEVGAKLLIETLPSILDKSCRRTTQNEEEVSFAYVPKRSDELLDFNDNAENIHNKVRGLYPSAYCLFDGTEMKILKTEILEKTYEGKIGEIVEVTKDAFIVKCQNNAIKVTEIKPFSKKQMLVKDYFNGIKKENLIGKCLNEK